MATSAPSLRMRPSARRRWLLTAFALVVAVAAVAGVVALNQARLSFDQRTAQSFAVGDCVVVPASAPDVVKATRAPCSVDASYTIGATTTASGSCPSAEYQHFPAPAADGPTSTLCLVPNLMADHCYQLDMPVGVVKLADCTASRTDPATGVLVQVTQRFDVSNQAACPTASGQFAWPYPAPARTYCTQTLF